MSRMQWDWKKRELIPEDEWKIKYGGGRKPPTWWEGCLAYLLVLVILVAFARGCETGEGGGGQGSRHTSGRVD